MDFDKYQKEIEKFDCFTEFNGNAGDPSLVEKTLGLVGEAGETADKFKKIIRDSGGEISDEAKKEIVKELGDVLWYVASISRYLDVKLSDVAQGNVDKLQSRLDRNKLHGAGDNR